MQFKIIETHIIIKRLNVIQCTQPEGKYCPFVVSVIDCCSRSAHPHGFCSRSKLLAPTYGDTNFLLNPNHPGGI